jgi:DNA-binding HxlR family transcriptional regulator
VITRNPERLSAASLDAAVRRVGDRWSLRIIGALLGESHTFGELTAEIGGIAPTVLTARLRSLQHAGLVHAEPYERRPVRMRYSLTEPGRRLAATILSLAEWGARREGHGPVRLHEACGTSVETRPWCPTCERTVADETAGELIWC